MKKRPNFLRGFLAAALALGGVALLTPPAAQGADHLDSNAAKADPSADLADWYAWTDPDGEHLNLAMTFMPLASDGAQFSTETVYAFHVNAHPDLLNDPGMSTLITCRFYDGTNLECWANQGDTVAAYIDGDAGVEAGAVNAEDNLRVFAGMRNDPFYFNLDGFLSVSQTVRSVVAGNPAVLGLDENGCPAGADETTRNALVGQLMTNPEGAPADAPIDDLAGANVMAIVMQVDLGLVTDSANTVLSTWASTHKIAE